MNPNTSFRLARPVRDLASARDMYCRGLGLQVLGHFENHAGFDGVMLGSPGSPFHFEFTVYHPHPVAPAPTPEDLWVFYVPDAIEWADVCARMESAGFLAVDAFNPYWARHGRTYADGDGYRTVIAKLTWPPEH